MTPLLFIISAFVCLISQASAHSYHLGTCPTVEPMGGFNMEKLLGKWYVIQKTSTGSKCLTYNFTATDEPNQYKVEQVSEHPVLGLVNVDNKYHYTGIITVPDRDTPAKMSVRFPLSVVGKASYTILMTDYTTFAALFSCQDLPFANRQSATILSRTKTLDKMYVDKVRQRLSSFGINPYELSVIEQAGCPNDENKPGVNINIDDQTLTPGSIAGVVRTAGDKLGDGVEYAANGAKKIYNTISARGNGRDREEIIVNQNTNADAEWLP